MQRNKGEFRALRETVGLSQADLARILDVNTVTAKRWENPRAERYHAPADAWELLDTLRENQAVAVEQSLAQVRDIMEQIGHAPDAIDLTYYRDAETFAENHPSDNADMWSVANANTRAVMVALNAAGIETHVHFADED